MLVSFQFAFSVYLLPIFPIFINRYCVLVLGSIFLLLLAVHTAHHHADDDTQEQLVCLHCLLCE